jgi:MurNAc alpha-1-phosphate uridylyltransferase
MDKFIDTVVIIAGGLATRLRPITEKIPKSLIEINKIPFIDYQLKYLKNQNIKQIIICAGFLGNEIQNYVGDGSKYGLSIKYSIDWPKLLGTGGCIIKALPLLPNSFFVLYGDSFLPINFLKISNHYFINKNQYLLTVFKNKNQFDTSNIFYSNNIIKKYDKFNIDKNMEYIDYGLSILTKTIFKDYAENTPIDLGTIYKDLSLTGDLNGLEVFERFYEIGSVKGIRDVEVFLKI